MICLLVARCVVCSCGRVAARSGGNGAWHAQGLRSVRSATGECGIPVEVLDSQCLARQGGSAPAEPAIA
jgi:hypothetical protein